MVAASSPWNRGRDLVKARLMIQKLFQLGDRVRHLHQAVDLTFPEFTRCVQGLDTELATAILSRYPTAAAFRRASAKTIAMLRFAAQKRVGLALATALTAGAKSSVAQHHVGPYELPIRSGTMRAPA